MRILTQNDGSSIIKAGLREGSAEMSTFIADTDRIDIEGSGNRSMNHTHELRFTAGIGDSAQTSFVEEYMKYQ